MDIDKARGKHVKLEEDEENKGLWEQGSVTVIEGHEAEIECFISGLPLPRIQWKDGTKCRVRFVSSRWDLL